MEVNFDDVVIIFQGYSICDQQLLDQLEYCETLGFKNIVISTYRKFVENLTLPDNVKVVLNDDGEESELKGASTQGSNSSGLTIKFDEKVFPETQPNAGLGGKVAKKLRIINLQLQTTKRGVAHANQEFPDAKYYLKLRLDMRIPTLDKKVRSWIPKITVNNGENQNRVYSHKLVVNRWHRGDWYLSDYWIFGYKEDINKYFSIPFIKRWGDITFKNRAIVESYFVSKYFQMALGKNFGKLKFAKVMKDYFICDKGVIKFNPRHHKRHKSWVNPY